MVIMTKNQHFESGVPGTNMFEFFVKNKKKLKIRVVLGGATFSLSSVGWCCLASFFGWCCVSFLFFRATLNGTQLCRKENHAVTHLPSLEVTGVPQHFMHGRRVAIHSRGTVAPKRRECKSPSSGTRQDRAPPPHPRRGRHVPHFSLRPNREGTERFRLRSGLRPLLRARPREPCLHHQPVPGSAPPSGVWQPQGGLHSFGLCAAWFFFFESRCRQASCSLEEEQPVIHDIKPACVKLVHHTKVQVSDEDICSHPPTSLSADSCSRVLEREPSASQRPGNSKGPPIMAKDVERTATPASTS